MEKPISSGGKHGFNFNRRNSFVMLLPAVVAIVFLFSLTVGRYHVPLWDTIGILLSRIIPLEPGWSGTMESVVLKLRLPRALAALLIGGALALSGASYQSLFKNPMVSPDLLGVSSGACIGASLSILLHQPAVVIQAAAFAGGIMAVFITSAIPRLMRSDSTVMLVLSGIIVSGLLSSVMGLIRYVADPDTALAQMVYWSMGSLAKVTMPDICVTAPGILVPGAVLLWMRYRLNVMSMGDEEARVLGVHVKRSRVLVIGSATLLTASAVSISGTIGWVGLVVPHLGRMLCGADNRRMLPAATMLGGVFMLVIDVLARTVTSAELPIGVLTGLLGAPFYFYLLMNGREHIR